MTFHKKNARSLCLPLSGAAGINEKLLQFIWQFQYFNSRELLTMEGEEVEVIHPGTLNKNQGPDFLDARIRIDKTVLAGHVELHLRTSHWNAHGHQHDPNYKNVILHVVYEDDSTLIERIPLIELKSRISRILLDRYSKLVQSGDFIPCGQSVSQVSSVIWTSWKDRLMIDRLSRKSDFIIRMLEQSQGHWEEVFWWMLARNFGTKINADAFENLARSINLNILSRHKNHIHQLEALLLGQAGLLNRRFSEAYPKMLQKEYHFLQKKYQLHPIREAVHFLRMRPGNFPTVRLAQLAILVRNSNHLFTSIQEAGSIREIRTMFQVTANDYWHYHYNFDEPSGYKRKHLGNDMIDNILVNTVIPMLFAHSLFHKNEDERQRALDWLAQLPAESNTIISGFNEIQVVASSAFDSQALIELKNEYCNARRCLMCTIGKAILKS